MHYIANFVQSVQISTLELFQISHRIPSLLSLRKIIL